MKMAFIMVKLVPEADEKANEDLEKEILKDLEESPRKPWMKEIMKVTVLELDNMLEGRNAR